MMVENEEKPFTPRVYLVTPDGEDYSPFSLDDLKPLFPELQFGEGCQAQNFSPISRKVFTNATAHLNNREDFLRLYSRNVRNLEHPKKYGFIKGAGYGAVYLHETDPAHITTARIPLNSGEEIEAIVILSRTPQRTDKVAKKLELPLDEKLTKLESLFP